MTESQHKVKLFKHNPDNPPRHQAVGDGDDHGHELIEEIPHSEEAYNRAHELLNNPDLPYEERNKFVHFNKEYLVKAWVSCDKQNCIELYAEEK